MKVSILVRDSDLRICDAIVFSAHRPSYPSSAISDGFFRPRSVQPQNHREIAFLRRIEEAC